MVQRVVQGVIGGAFALFLVLFGGWQWYFLWLLWLVLRTATRTIRALLTGRRPNAWKHLRDEHVRLWQGLVLPLFETLIFGAPRHPLPDMATTRRWLPALRLASLVPWIVVGVFVRLPDKTIERMVDYVADGNGGAEGDPRLQLLAIWERLMSRVPLGLDRLIWLSAATRMPFRELDFARRIRHEVAHPSGSLPADQGQVVAALAILHRAEAGLRHISQD
jgi:hypothetical protein